MFTVFLEFLLYLIPAIPIVTLSTILVYLISTVKKLYKKIILSILLISSLYTVFMLGTRGAFLGLIICFGLYTFYLIINYKTIKNLKMLAKVKIIIIKLMNQIQNNK